MQTGSNWDLFFIYLNAKIIESDLLSQEAK
jgi:hypothetical protein